MNLSSKCMHSRGGRASCDSKLRHTFTASTSLTHVPDHRRLVQRTIITMFDSLCHEQGLESVCGSLDRQLVSQSQHSTEPSRTAC